MTTITIDQIPVWIKNTSTLYHEMFFNENDIHTTIIIPNEDYLKSKISKNVHQVSVF